MAKLKITLTKSTNRAKKDQIATVKAIGLSRIGQTIEQEDTPAMRGMVRKVAHLVCCEEA